MGSYICNQTNIYIEELQNKSPLEWALIGFKSPNQTTSSLSPQLLFLSTKTNDLMLFCNNWALASTRVLVMARFCFLFLSFCFSTFFFFFLSSNFNNFSYWSFAIFLFHWWSLFFIFLDLVFFLLSEEDIFLPELDLDPFSKFCLDFRISLSQLINRGSCRWLLTI